MINDFKKDHYYSIYEELPLIKNISFIMDTGKYILLDNKGNHYICDMFGQEQPLFKRNISGFINGEQRKKLKKDKSLPNVMKSNYSQDNINNKKKEEETKSYYPLIKRFDGYTQFPRPLCPPFTNIPDNILNDNYKRLLISQVESKFNVEENKKIFSLKKERIGLSYITSNIKGYIDKEKEKKDMENDNNKKKNDKLFLINMIDNTVNDYKIKYNCGLNELLKNHSMIRALLNLKKNLINNNDTNLINGKKLKEPNDYIINEYKIIHNNLNDYYKQIKINKDKKRILKCFSQMDIKRYKNINNNENDNNISKIFKKTSINKSTINSKEVSSTINNDYDKKTIPKKIFMILNKGNKTNLLNENKNKENENNNDSKYFNEIIDDNDIKNIYEEQETKETLGNKYNNILNRNCTNESNKDDNLSVISFLNEKENEKYIKFNKKVRYLKTLKKNSEEEKKHLIGYKKEEPKKIKILNLNEEEQPKYRDFAEIYKKEQETFEKCNPIIYSIQKKNNDNELKKLLRKMHFKKLNEKIKLKGKTFTINKSFSKK